MNLRLNFLSFALIMSLAPTLGACGKKAEAPPAPLAATPEPAKPAPEPAKPEPAKPEAAKPAEPEPAKPAEPEPAKPAEPEAAKPAEPEVAKPAEPEAAEECKLLSFGRLAEKAKSYDTLLELATKLYSRQPDGPPKTEEAAKAMLWAFANGGPDKPAPPYPANGIYIINTGDYGPTGSIQSLLVPKEGAPGYWVAEGVTVADPPAMGTPTPTPETEAIFAAVLAKSGEPQAIAPYFPFDQATEKYGERRVYETWVDAKTGTQIRFVRTDSRKDQKNLGESIMQAGYWEGCNQLFKVDPSEIGKVDLLPAEFKRDFD